MIGIDNRTGQTLAHQAWLNQQITDILTTPRGSRTMNAEYGSNLYLLIDKNIDENMVFDISTEVALSLLVLAKIYQFNKVAVAVVDDIISLTISGKDLISNTDISHSITL